MYKEYNQIERRAEGMLRHLVAEYRAQGLRSYEFSLPGLSHLTKAERAKIGLEGECWSSVYGCPILGRVGPWYIRPAPMPVMACIPSLDGKGLEFVEIAEPECKEGRRFWSSGYGTWVALEGRRMVRLALQRQVNRDL
jgi:hypothetical protein